MNDSMQIHFASIMLLRRAWASSAVRSAAARSLRPAGFGRGRVEAKAFPSSVFTTRPGCALPRSSSRSLFREQCAPASASASASVSASTSKSEVAQKPVDDMDLAALRLVVALADEAPSRDALGTAEAELLRKRRLAAGGSSGEDTDKDKDENEDEDEDEDDEDLWPHLSPVSDKECWAEVKSLLAAQLELRGGDERNALMRHLCEVEAAILRDHMSLASTAC